MAFAKAQVLKESNGFKNYLGVAEVEVVAINPSKDKLSEIYGREYEKEPVYTAEVQTANGDTVKQARVSFILRVIPEKNDGIEFFHNLTFFINDEKVRNRDNTKAQIIDEYGRTAWATVEEFTAKKIPQYGSGPANITNNYRIVYRGEEQLVEFLKAWMGIPRCDFYNENTKKWEMKSADKLADCTARLDEISKYFSGDMSEITSLESVNSLKVLFGLKESDGRTYADVFKHMFLTKSANQGSLDRLSAKVLEVKNRGSYPNTTFDVSPLHEHKVEATSFENNDASDLPFGEAIEDPFEN